MVAEVKGQVSSVPYLSRLPSSVPFVPYLLMFIMFFFILSLLKSTREEEEEGGREEGGRKVVGGVTFLWTVEGVLGRGDEWAFEGRPAAVLTTSFGRLISGAL